MTMKHLLAAAAALAIAAPGLANEDDDKIILEQYQTKIAALKADANTSRYAASLITQADNAYRRLKDNLDEGDGTDVRANTREIDALVQAAKLRGQTAAAKAEIETLQARRAEDRVQTAAQRAADAEARAAAAQARANALQNQLRDYQLRQTALGATLVLQDVIFETDRAELRPGAVDRLRPLVAYLQSSPNVRVRIEGHTDSRGTTAYNQNLSNARANAVKTALAGAGVDAGRIDALGYGESRPVATNRTTAGQQANRRVEITLLGQRTDQLALQ